MIAATAPAAATVSGFAVLGCYALGCVAAGYYLVRWRSGRDLRTVGSGSVGASNAARYAGTRAAVLIALLDIAKGVVAVAIARFLGLAGGWLVAAVLAVTAGHVFPAQLGFRGGKGVATGFGAMLVLDWRVALLGLALLLITLALSRRRGLAGVVAFASAPVTGILLQRPWTTVAAGAPLAALILWTHRRNLSEEFRPLRTGLATSIPHQENACATGQDSSSRSPPTKASSRRSTA
jgi:acyl phosphate:glycerol-3-phosphate acyltransferase